MPWSNTEPVMTLLEQRVSCAWLLTQEPRQVAPTIWWGPCSVVCTPQRSGCKSILQQRRHWASSVVHALRAANGGAVGPDQTVPEAYMLATVLCIWHRLTTRDAIALDGMVPGGRPKNRTGRWSDFDPSFKAERVELPKPLPMNLRAAGKRKIQDLSLCPGSRWRADAGQYTGWVSVQPVWQVYSFLLCCCSVFAWRCLAPWRGSFGLDWKTARPPVLV